MLLMTENIQQLKYVLIQNVREIRAFDGTSNVGTSPPTTTGIIQIPVQYPRTPITTRNNSGWRSWPPGLLRERFLIGHKPSLLMGLQLFPMGVILSPLNRTGHIQHLPLSIIFTIRVRRSRDSGIPSLIHDEQSFNKSTTNHFCLLHIFLQANC